MEIFPKQHRLPRVGAHKATILEITDVAPMRTHWDNQNGLKDSELPPKMAVVFRIDDEFGKDGQPMTLKLIFTKSVERNTSFRKLLRALGVKYIYTPDVPFKTESLLGRQFDVEILHLMKCNRLEAYIAYKPRSHRQQATEVIDEEDADEANEANA